ncbi:MAG: HNH endonuclease [Candidatus Thermoplasmatota archaeon]|nr:HNH endonuclease [Candidatus Thermoplasmatota archaeon]
MILINRVNCPACLIKPPEQFIKGDCDKPEVKTALHHMQHGKCCYCEKKIKFRAGATIEHFIPKSYYHDGQGSIIWRMANDWNNLLMACNICNDKKLDKLPITAGIVQILNPTSDLDPEDHIDFVFAEDFFIGMKEKNGSLEGQSTIDKLKFFERSDLRPDYNCLILEINKIFNDLLEALIDDNKLEINELKGQLTRLMSAHKPYTAFRRNYIQKKLEKVNREYLPILECHHDHHFSEVAIDFPRGYETR